MRPGFLPSSTDSAFSVVHDLLLDRRDLRGRGLRLRLRLRDVHLRRHAVLELQLEYLQRLVVGAQRLLRNGKLLIERAQVQIVVGDLRHQREDHAAARLVGRQQVRLGGLGLPTDAPPQVDLPARARDDAVAGLCARSGRLVRQKIRRELLARAARVVSDLRIKRGLRFGEYRCGLLHVGCRLLHTLVVRKRFGDQLVEHRIAELLPPLGVDRVGRVLRQVFVGAGVSICGR